MDAYIGMRCPYCRAEIEAGDSIVVCSSCEMPHHKDCWVENQGCTTFGCMGTIQGVAADGTVMEGAGHATAKPLEHVIEEEHIEEKEKHPAPPPSARRMCFQCGNTLQAADRFCSQCGRQMEQITETGYPTSSHPMPSSYAPHTSGGMEDRNDEESMSTFLRHNVEYYNHHFDCMSESDLKVSWNFSAFLLGPQWFILRKMHAVGIGIIVFLLFWYQVSGSLGLIISGMVHLLSGVLGNRIYMQYANKRIKEARLLNEPYHSQFMRRRGGINVINACITTLLTLVFIVILSASTTPRNTGNHSWSFMHDKCAHDGCNNEAKYGMYCINHVCMYGSCTNEKTEDGEYCILHMDESEAVNVEICMVNGCDEDGEFGGYCIDHVCWVGNCTNPSVEGTNYCAYHIEITCLSPDCEEVAEYGPYCIYHVCLEGECENPRLSHGDYCAIHSYLDTE